MKNAKSLLRIGVLQFILFVFPWTKLKKFFKKNSQTRKRCQTFDIYRRKKKEYFYKQGVLSKKWIGM